jgi:hypothetical protein
MNLGCKDMWGTGHLDTWTFWYQDISAPGYFDTLAFWHSHILTPRHLEIQIFLNPDIFTLGSVHKYHIHLRYCCYFWYCLLVSLFCLKLSLTFISWWYLPPSHVSPVDISVPLMHHLVISPLPHMHHLVISPALICITWSYLPPSLSSPSRISLPCMHPLVISPYITCMIWSYLPTSQALPSHISLNYMHHLIISLSPHMHLQVISPSLIPPSHITCSYLCPLSEESPTPYWHCGDTVISLYRNCRQ